MSTSHPDPDRCRTPPRRLGVPLDVAAEVAAARRELDLLVQRLVLLRTELARPGAAECRRVVEGVFQGDPDAAVATTRLWVDRSLLVLHSPGRSLAQAHVAAGGLVAC